jgi:glycosyltransferase involved in cell wall biosynthesis
VVPADPHEMRRLIDRVRPDVVHAGPIEPIARLAAEAGACPLVAVSWGFDLLRDAQGWARDRIAGTLARSDALLVDCEAAAAVSRDMGMAPDRIFNIPWGVDLDRFRPDPDRATRRRRLGWEGKVVVVSARSHEPQYGIDIIVDAFAAVAAAIPNLQLIVLGDGSLTPQLVAQALETGASGRVTFGGRVPSSELAGYLQAADIYVAASHVDGSSVTLLEAMAAGLPPVVSDIPGNREWVESGSNGLLYADGATASLRAALADLGGDAARRSAMGVRSRNIVAARADWSKNRLILDVLYRTATRAAANRRHVPSTS